MNRREQTQPLDGVRVLIVDPDAVAARSLGKQVEALGGAVTRVAESREAISLIQRQSADVIVAAADLAVGDADHSGLLKHSGPAASSIVVIATHGRVDTAVRAMRMGAVDFLVKPVDADRLTDALSRAAANASLLGPTTSTPLSPVEGLVGTCPAICKARETINAIGTTGVPVLVTGPSGTGLTHVSRLLHRVSGRDGKPVKLDASEATARRFNQAVGKAERGTLIIENGESITKALASALVTYLDDDDSAGPRLVIEATSQAAIERQAPELAERVRSVHIELPPLAERGGDVVLLADHLLSKHAAKLDRRRKLSDASRASLRGYDWPGQVRELDTAMQGVAAASTHTEIDWRPPDTRALAAGREGTLAEQMEEAERQAIRVALEAEDWRRTATAERLGINRATLYKKMRALGIE